MNTSLQKILPLCYLIFGIASEYFLLWLFPYTGLGGLICYPTTILLSLVFGFLLFKLLKNGLTIGGSALIFLIFFAIQLSIQMCFLPQEIGGTPFSKIEHSIRAYINYDKISIADLSKLDREEKAVFIYKYRNNLPSSFIILTIDSGRGQNSNPREYVIININRKKNYDKGKINIVENDTATLINEFRGHDTSLYKMTPNFMNIVNGGFVNDTISIYIEEDSLKLKTGIDKLLYTITAWTKKPV